MAAWQATDRLNFNFDAYRSKSDRDSGGKDTWVVSGIAGSHVGRVRHEQQRPARHQRHARGRARLATALQQRRARQCRLRPALHRPVRHRRDRQGDGLHGGGRVRRSTRRVQRRCSSAPPAPSARKMRNTIENDTNGGSCQYCNHLRHHVREPRRERRAHRCRCRNFMRNGGGSYPKRFVSFDVAAVSECAARARRPAACSTRTATRPARSTTRRSPRRSSIRCSRTT